MRQMNLTELVNMANANISLMDGTLAPIRGLVRDHDVVIAIWHENTWPEGIGTKIIKGRPIVELAAKSSEDYRCKLTAIKCTSEDQAHGLALVFGQADHNDDSLSAH